LVDYLLIYLERIALCCSGKSIWYHFAVLMAALWAALWSRHWRWKEGKWFQNLAQSMRFPLTSPSTNYSQKETT